MPDTTSNRISRPNSVKNVRLYIISILRNNLDNASEITSDKISEYMAGKNISNKHKQIAIKLTECQIEYLSPAQVSDRLRHLNIFVRCHCVSG